MGIVGTTAGTLWYINWTESTSIRLISGHKNKVRGAGVVCPAEQRVLCLLSMPWEACAGCRSVPWFGHGRGQGAAGLASADRTTWRSLQGTVRTEESNIKKSELIRSGLRCLTASAREQLWAFLLEQKNVVCSH